MSVYFCIFFYLFLLLCAKRQKNSLFSGAGALLMRVCDAVVLCVYFQASYWANKQTCMCSSYRIKKVRFFFFIKTKWNMNVHLLNVLIFICLLFMISHLFSSLPHSWSLMRAHWACNWKVQIHTLNVNLIRFIETLTKRREDKKKIRINNRELGAVDMMIYKLSINWIDKPDCFLLEEHSV